MRNFNSLRLECHICRSFTRPWFDSNLDQTKDFKIGINTFLA